MKRRSFIRNASLAGLSLTTLSLASCNATSTTTENNEETFEDKFKLNEVTVHELQSKMQSGVLTSHAITQMYLDRISAIDKNGPKLSSVIEVNPDALSIADAMDDERKNGKVRGPLHGIPVLIKDNID